MKILVFGASGKMGRAVVSHMANDPEVSVLGLLDVKESLLKSMVSGDRSKKLKLHPVDVNDVNTLKEIMKEYDVGVLTLPNRHLSYKVFEAAIEVGLNLVDVLEEYHRRPDKYETEGFTIPSTHRCGEEYGEWLHEKAVKNDMLILDGMGFAPGLSNITVARAISLMDKVKSAVARVGAFLIWTIVRSTRYAI